MSKVEFRGLSDAAKGEISPRVIEMLQEAAEASDNEVITITSARRHPWNQAEAMYNNIAAGKVIRYAAPGAAVTKLCQERLAQGHAKNCIIAEMVDLIEELSAEGARVSKHCVSIKQYQELNVIDVSFQCRNPRDFTVEIAKKAKRIITPLRSLTGNYPPHVLIDSSEPAIHIEISPNQ